MYSNNSLIPAVFFGGNVKKNSLGVWISIIRNNFYMVLTHDLITPFATCFAKFVSTIDPAFL